MADRTARTAAPAAPALLVAVALGIVYVVWGSTYLAIRIAVEQAPPLTAMGLRFTTAGLVLGVIVAVRNGVGTLRLTRRRALGCLFLGLMLPLLGNGMVSVGENLGAESGFVALLIAVVPLVVVIFRTVEGDRPGGRTLSGVLLGFAGLALLVIAAEGGGKVSVGPSLIVVFAASCWALGSYLQPRLDLPENPFVTAVYEMLFGGLLMTTVGLVSGERFTFDYSARTWLALGYLVLFGSVLAFSSYVWVVARAPISLVATYAYVNPVIAVLLGWLVLDEQMTTAMLVGGAVVVASVALVITAERGTTPTPETPEPSEPPEPSETAGRPQDEPRTLSP